RHTRFSRDWSSDVCSSDLETEERPSRFLAELGLGEPERIGTGRRWLSLPALVADLRSVVTDPGRPDPLRRAAAAHLARLAAAGEIGRAAGRERGESAVGGG